MGCRAVEVGRRILGGDREGLAEEKEHSKEPEWAMALSISNATIVVFPSMSCPGPACIWLCLPQAAMLVVGGQQTLPCWGLLQAVEEIKQQHPAQGHWL